jgi:putative endopeptidase
MNRAILSICSSTCTRHVGLVLSALCFVGMATSPSRAAVTASTVAAPAPTSGIETRYIDHSVRPQDDFYRYVNGGWLDATEIPADMERASPSAQVDDAIREHLKTIVEQAQQSPGTDADRRKIGDFYASFMDEQALEALRLKPLKSQFALIDALKDKRGMAGLMGRLEQSWIEVPVSIGVLPDQKDAKTYAAYANPAGLGMPSRDYYLSNDPKLAQVRAAYAQHVERMLGIAGDKDAARHAKEILALETRMASAQWSIADADDPVRTYNKVDIAALASAAPGYDWSAFFTAAGVADKSRWVIVSEPSYMKEFGRIVEQTPLPVWRTYLRWQVLNTYAPFLSHDFVAEAFAFDSTTLRGTTQDKPRWKRGIDVVEEAMGEGLGRLYVKQYVPPAAKKRLEAMAANIVDAFHQEIDTRDWMAPETKRRAQQKLAKLRVKIGYPDRWRDYSKLRIVRGDLIGNVMRARSFEYHRNVDKLGTRVDPDEWGMTPQTVDAYADASLNQITFAAGLMNPPFFDAQADDASNYGAIGGTMGHEISHLFDNGGSQYDGDGTLLGQPGWFTVQDQQRFNARTHALVVQYSAFEPLPRYHVNGEQTLPENIADNSGLAIAYKAYHLSLHGKPAPVIDGLTGDQRFFMAWTQKWRAKVRDAETIRLLKSDEHSPRSIRGIAPLRNLAAFYDAFDIKRGDKMYLPPEQRVSIW